jgi:hypothetical protein
VPFADSPCLTLNFEDFAVQIGGERGWEYGKKFDRPLVKCYKSDIPLPIGVEVQGFAGEVRPAPGSVGVQACEGREVPAVYECLELQN